MRFVAAPARLAPHVLGVVISQAGAPATFTLPAHALAVFTVVLRGSLSLAAPHAPLLQAGMAAGCGSATQAQVFQGSDDLLCASLLCRASVLPRLSGEPASVFRDAFVPADLFGPVPWEALCGNGHGALGAEAIAAALFAMIEARLVRARSPRPSAERFAASLAMWDAVREPGAPHAIAPPGWSERQWQRACQAELGVAPKLLQRLARLHASVRAREVAPPHPWAEHALEAGYFDQAHLARDYRLLAGLRPGQSQAQELQAQSLRLGSVQLAPRFFDN